MAATKSRLGRGLGNLIAAGVSKSSTPAKPSANKAKPTPPKARKKPTPQPKPKPKSKPAPEKAKLTSAPAAKAISAPNTSANGTQPKTSPTPAPTPAPAPVTDGFATVAVDSIEVSPYQPRRDIDPSSIAELAESIRSEGLLQPPVVRRTPNGRYQLIAGERRWRACQSIGMKQIPVRVMTAGDASAATMSLIENLQREDLDPIEEALGYASLMRDFDLTQDAVSQRVGKARATVANSLRLLSLDREIQGLISSKQLSTGHAKVLCGIEDPAQRHILARRIVEEGLSVRTTEQLAARLKAGSPLTSGTHRSTRAINPRDQAVIDDLERRLTSSLNTRVKLHHTPKKGRIVIEYQGNDDLQRILSRIGFD